MIKGGYTLWSRETINSDIFFYKTAMWFKIWFYIINRVNHKDTKLFSRGESLITYEEIMKSTKASKQQVKDCIHYLEKDHMIESRKTTRGMIRKVLNYGIYQNPKNYKTTTRPQDRPLEDHLKTPPINNNDNNDKNIYASKDYLLTIPKKDLEEINKDIGVSMQSIISKGKQLYDWCEANGKTKKNYRAFLRVCLRSDIKTQNTDIKQKDFNSLLHS